MLFFKQYLSQTFSINWRIINNNNHLIINHQKKKTFCILKFFIYIYIFCHPYMGNSSNRTKDTNDPKVVPIGQSLRATLPGFSSPIFVSSIRAHIFPADQPARYFENLLSAIQQQRSSWLAPNKWKTKPVFELGRGKVSTLRNSRLLD